MEEMLLIDKVREECDNTAFYEIVKTYIKMVESIVNNYDNEFSAYRLNRDDLRQEALIGLYEACKSYKIDMNTKFSTFAYTCIKRRVHRFYSRYVKHYCAEVTSLDSFGTQDPGFIYCDTFANETQTYLKKEHVNEALNALMSSLNYEDRMIIDMRASNYSYKEISDKLNINKKRVDNRLSKIKRKFSSGEFERMYN